LGSRYLLAFFGCLFSVLTQAQVFDVPHSETSTRTFLVSAQNPKALVLLFPGGGGMMRMQDDGSTKNRHTFVRSLDQWSQYHIDAVLVDTPYDLGDLQRGDLRDRSDHLERVHEVASYYKDKYHLPIWIFGHSMGTSTATNFANSLDKKSHLISGIIIAGTVRTASVDDSVSMPILALHHVQDSCLGSPPDASARIVNKRPFEFVSELEMIDGGISEGDVCQSFAYHGFNQTETELIKRAAKFILGN